MNAAEHNEIQDLLGAYALDAVELDERRRVEAHLAGCSRCRAEVADHRDTAASLAFAGGDAPAGLWDRIAGEIRAGRPDSVPERGATARARRRRWIAPAAAAASIVAAAALGAQVVLERDRVDRAETASATVERLAERALTADDARVADLKGDIGPDVRAVVEPSGTGFVFAEELPTLPDDQTYQLWGVRGDTVVSLGVFGPDPGVVAFTAASDTEVLAITAEKAGGVVSSKNDPVVAGPLT